MQPVPNASELAFKAGMGGRRLIIYLKRERGLVRKHEAPWVCMNALYHVLLLINIVAVVMMLMEYLPSNTIVII